MSHVNLGSIFAIVNIMKTYFKLNNSINYIWGF